MTALHWTSVVVLFVFFYFHCFPCYLLHTSCLPFCSAILKQRLSSWIKFFFYYCWLYQWTSWYCLFACFKLWKWLSSNLKDSKLWCCLLLHNLPMTDIHVDMLYVAFMTKHLQTSGFPSSDLEHLPLTSLWVSFILLKQNIFTFTLNWKGKVFPKEIKPLFNSGRERGSKILHSQWGPLIVASEE